ncbi:MAG: hypothetical protein R6V85_18595 [Polyangia bacterium]
MPDDIDSLLSLADREARANSSIEDLTVAVSALEKAADQVAESRSSVPLWEIHWRLGRACFLASERSEERSDKLLWIQRGEDAARAAMRERLDRVEGYYFSAALLGRRAELSGLGFSAIKLAKEVEDLGKKAVEIDPSFEDGAPYRLLAMLYAKAPPWPTSIGDIDLALEYADRALQLSNYPMNHMVRAEVLIEAGDFGEARAELRNVLSAPKVGRWAREGEHWRPRARRLLSKLDNR